MAAAPICNAHCRDPLWPLNVDSCRPVSANTGHSQRLFGDFDALGCLRSLRARSALDAVSWVQGG